MLHTPKSFLVVSIQTDSSCDSHQMWGSNRFNFELMSMFNFFPRYKSKSLSHFNMKFFFQISRYIRTKLSSNYHWTIASPIISRLKISDSKIKLTKMGSIALGHIKTGTTKLPVSVWKWKSLGEQSTMNWQRIVGLP